MPRKATGQVIEDPRRPGVFGLRFRAYGKRHYEGLGRVSRAEAEARLRYLLADVERGIWQPPAPAIQPEPRPHEVNDPTFHEFASEWFADHKARWRENTVKDYEWQLTHHLLPFFARHRLSEITAREIDRYTAAKVREGLLSPASINKTVTRLGQILKRAKRYKLIAENPVTDSERLKVPRPAAVWLDRAEHIAALVDAARELDREARRDRRHVARKATLATLVFAGLRIGELLDLCWRDVDLTAGRITVRASKTDAGVRQVDMLPVLRDELLALKASARRAGPTDLVFATGPGKRQGATNIRRRVLAPAVARANERLAEAGEVPLPERLTPHKLRHTFASLLVALGVDPGSAMDQLGHTDPAFTLRVYRHAMRRDDASKQALRELVGAPTDSDAIRGEFGQPTLHLAPRLPGFAELEARESLMGTAGLEPATSRV